MYALDNVSKFYDRTCVLRDITAEIETDRFVFVLGPSGSGKSTLLRLLSFVEVPERGIVHLELDGHKFDSNKSERPWPQVTTVFQRQFLWPHLTLRDNISLPLRAAGTSDTKRRVHEVIDLFDMSRFVDRFPNEVSGGQAQRAALARALVLDPQVILIDEAHGGLDLKQQKILNDHLIDLRKSGVGLIIVTHSLDFARSYADRIVVVENGAITETGSKSVLDSPTSQFLQRALGF